MVKRVRSSIVGVVITTILISIGLLAQANAVVAAPSLSIFDEFLYLTAYTWGGTAVDPTNTNNVYAGNVSLAVDFGGPFAGFSLLNSNAPTDITDYDILQLWANGGGQTIQISLVDGNGGETASPPVALGHDWQLVEIPLSQFGASTFSGLKIGEAGGQTTPATVYLDNIQLIDTDVVPTPTEDPNAPTPTLPPTDFDGMRMVGRHLYDRCGEQVILRGVNRMVWWLDVKHGITPPYAEIAQTGANVVRIQWLAEDNEDPARFADMIINELDGAIQGAVDHGLIPMVELHDATLQGANFDLLDEMVDFWVSPEIVPILQKHEQYLLLNIANEIGTDVTDADFRAGYMEAITRIRNAGLRMPIVIDGTDWGKDIDQMQAVGPELIEFDPEHSLLFSVHTWWPEKWGYTPGRVVQEFRESAETNFPLIVGEFGNSWDEPTTPDGDLPWRTILEYAELYDIGWLAWSWGDHQPGNSHANNPQNWLDMTEDSTFATLHDWGLEVAVTSPFSLQNTSVRPQSMITGQCNDSGTPVPTATPSATNLPPTATPMPTNTPIVTSEPPTSTPPATATAVPPTATSTPPATGTCSVSYLIVNQWNTGFQAEITITNNSNSAIAGYDLVWSYDNEEQLSSGWNATFSQSGATMTASNPASTWNGTIPANANVSFGMIANYNTSTTIPETFTLNGVVCE